MAKKIGNLCAPNGTYIKDGEERTSWIRCGVLLETDKGFRVKLDTIPVGGEGHGIWFSVFEDDQGHGQGSAPKPAQKPSQDVDPDREIPF
jgi:hypothetical protein